MTRRNFEKARSRARGFHSFRQAAAGEASLRRVNVLVRIVCERCGHRAEITVPIGRALKLRCRECGSLQFR